MSTPKVSKISISNKTNVNISSTVVKYDYENFPDIKPLTINSNSTKTWDRYLDRDYFCFLSESKVLYGFLCKGGKDYEYLGKGQMRIPQENRIYRLEHEVAPIKHNLRILAVLENVEISICKEKDFKKPIVSQVIKKNEDLIIELTDGYYFLKIKNDESVYGVIPGKSYYIAKGQVLVEVKDNIIKKPHRDNDVKNELE